MIAESRPTGQLRPHPLNATIYGVEVPDKSLRESIEQDGIITPLVIDQDDTILSGHRRWRVADLIGLVMVPVVVRELNDSLEGERVLIESNRQREKTTSQRQREADELVRIIGTQAQSRMRAGVRNPRPMLDEGSAITPTSLDTGRTDQRVAEMVGAKRSTFRKERTIYQVATGQREAPPEVVEVAKEQVARLDAGKTTVHAAEQKVRAALHAPTAEQKAEASAETTELVQTVLGADATLHEGGVAKIALLREVGRDARTLYSHHEDDVCVAFERHPDMTHTLDDIRRVRRWAAAIERRIGVIHGGIGQSGQGVG